VLRDVVAEVELDDDVVDVLVLDDPGYVPG
jgi:hypothetical protein